MAVPKVRILRLEAATDKTLTRVAAIENRDAQDIAADVLTEYVAKSFDRDGHRAKTASLSASDDPDVDRLVKLANGLRGVG